MKTRYVFIDTNIFDEVKCDLENKYFGKLHSFAKKGTVSLLVPEVIKREVEAHIVTKHGPELASQISKAVKTLTHFSWLHKKKIPKFDVDGNSIVLTLQEKFESFFVDTKAKHLSNDVSVKDLMDRYFAGQPPFGPSRKKCEFPDAIAIESLNVWHAKHHDETIHIVSNDGDFEGAGPHFKLYKSLAELIDDVLSEEEFVFSSKKWLQSKRKRLGRFIEKEGFSKIEFNPVDYDDATVLAVDLQSLKVAEISVIDYRRNTSELTFDVKVDVHFEVKVDHEDLDTATWDSEDKRLIPHRNVTESWEFEERYTFSVDAMREDNGELTFIDVTPAEYLVFLSKPDEWLK